MYALFYLFYLFLPFVSDHSVTLTIHLLSAEHEHEHENNKRPLPLVHAMICITFLYHPYTPLRTTISSLKSSACLNTSPSSVITCSHLLLPCHYPSTRVSLLYTDIWFIIPLVITHSSLHRRRHHHLHHHHFIHQCLSSFVLSLVMVVFSDFVLNFCLMES